MILLPTPQAESNSKSIPIKDHTGRIFAMGIGMPGDDGQPEEQKWQKAMSALKEAIEEAQGECSFAPKDLDHHCGSSSGQVMPGNLTHSQVNCKVL